MLLSHYGNDTEVTASTTALSFLPDASSLPFLSPVADGIFGTFTATPSRALPLRQMGTDRRTDGCHWQHVLDATSSLVQNAPLPRRRNTHFHDLILSRPVTRHIPTTYGSIPFSRIDRIGY